MWSLLEIPKKPNHSSCWSFFSHWIQRMCCYGSKAKKKRQMTCRHVVENILSNGKGIFILKFSSFYTKFHMIVWLICCSKSWIFCLMVAGENCWFLKYVENIKKRVLVHPIKRCYLGVGHQIMGQITPNWNWLMWLFPRWFSIF